MLNTEVGKDISAESLKDEFDAIILCIGAQKQRELHMEGSDSNGVHLAMDYLTFTTKSLLDSNFADGKFINTKGKDVIVIGGGDTGADCVATAIRQNCKSVRPIRKTSTATKYTSGRQFVANRFEYFQIGICL